ncbi:MAG: hypothetical protein AAGE52_28140 [Myxococcota bacterium]
MRVWLAIGLVALTMEVGAQTYRDGTPHFWPAGAEANTLEPPAELAGFRFGWTRREAARACARAGEVWSEGTPISVCSGPARDPGFSAKVRVRFCADRLCETTAIVQREPLSAYPLLLRSMKRAFGNEEVERIRASDDCRHELAEGRSEGCDEVSARHFWNASGYELFVGLETPRGLRVVFRTPSRVAQLSATSD